MLRTNKYKYKSNAKKKNNCKADSFLFFIMANTFIFLSLNFKYWKIIQVQVKRLIETEYVLL